MRGSGREHLHEVFWAAGGLVGIQQHRPALMYDEIELAIVKTEFASQLAHFLGNRHGLTTDRLGRLDQGVWRDVAGATFALSAKHPEPRRETIRFFFRNELVHDQIVALEDAIRDIANRSVDLIGLQDWHVRKRRWFPRAPRSPIEERLWNALIVEVAFDDDRTLPSVSLVHQRSADPSFGYVGRPDIEAEWETPCIVEIVRGRYRRIDMQNRDVGAVCLRQTLLNPDRMAAPFQFSQNVEKQIGTAPAQQDIALAKELIVLMRYDDDTRHSSPLGFHTHFHYAAMGS